MLNGIETRFSRDERNDDSILEDEIVGEFEEFMHKVQPLGTMSNFAVGFNERNDLFDFNAGEFNTIPGTSLVGDAFVHFLKWVNVISEYIEIVKGSLQQWSMLDFIDPALTWFVEHEMLTVWKEFRGQNHRHFKKSNHRKIGLLERSSPTTTAAPPSHFYNNMLAEKQGHSIDHVELFKKTHARGGQFISQAMVDAHISLRWGPKPKPRQAIGSSSSTSVERELAYAREVNELRTHLEVEEEESNRKHEENARLIEAQAWQMEEMRKMIEELSRASRGS
ncbi:CACTA en-spm transposon protein [Cucumis melo var. makuwa]|uniref:CACTA en-spm transposon protein n=1 Tax=Cucumis melo var. makuwa TaxID=1194695 RepID=A0A5D3DHJ7_CUCMM|nr:CACTA en-spm transposon protein [Cucumis melo var. makuwa]